MSAETALGTQVKQPSIVQSPKVPNASGVSRMLIDQFAFTPLGILSMSIGGWVYYRFGQEEQDFLLYMMGPAFSLFAVTLFLIAYIERWRLKRTLGETLALDPVEVEVGQDLMTGFSIPSIHPNPLFQIQVLWQKPKVHEYHLEYFDGELKELIKPKRRGKVVEVTRVFTLEDIFGFTTLKWSFRQSCDLSVWPQSTPAHELDLRRPQLGEDLYDPIGEVNGDLVELRRYENGDPLKLVMWRVYARNRQLVVRSPERALSERKDLVVYFIAHPSDEPSASTARAYLEAGLLGDDFLFIADGCQRAVSHSDEVMNQLLSSADSETLSALPVLHSLPEQQQRGVVIFASALTPPELLSKVVNSLPSPPLVILSLSFEVEDEVSTRSLWWSKLFKEESSSDRSEEGLRQARAHFDMLSSMREPVLIAQPSSKTISRDLLNELTEDFVPAEDAS